jgi:hypothetical protein
MPELWIAISGAADTHRTDINLRRAAEALTAAKVLGGALADSSCGIIVYSSNAGYIESHVVSGYVASDKVTDGSILVVYPRGSPRPAFEEQASKPSCFKFKLDQNPNWEVSFYRSLYRADGIILIGGGQATFAAGIVAASLTIPIIPVESFGGAASKVWELLAPADGLITDDEKTLMASEEGPTPQWATGLVACLIDQITRKKTRLRLEEDARRYRQRSLTFHAVFAALLLAASLALFVLTWDAPGISRVWLLTAIASAPALAGSAASIVRSLWEGITRNNSTPTQSVWPLTILGGVAGAISGLLYVIAQLTALLPGDHGQLPQVAGRLVPFALLTGFLAGFAADAFFRKLGEREVSAIQIPTFRTPT